MSEKRQVVRMHDPGGCERTTVPYGRPLGESPATTRRVTESRCTYAQLGLCKASWRDVNLRGRRPLSGKCCIVRVSVRVESCHEMLRASVSSEESESLLSLSLFPSLVKNASPGVSAVAREWGTWWCVKETPCRPWQSRASTGQRYADGLPWRYDGLNFIGNISP